MPKKMYLLDLIKGAWSLLVMVKMAPLLSMERGESLPTMPFSGFQKSRKVSSFFHPSPPATVEKSKLVGFLQFPKAGSGAHSGGSG